MIALNVDGRVPVIGPSCKVISGKQFKKDCKLVKLFAMASRSSDADEAEGVDEGVPTDDGAEYMSGPERHPTQRLKQSLHTISFVTTPKPLLQGMPQCQQARMMVPPAKKKGGQKRLETKCFGNHIVADHTVVKANVEEGVKGETVALVMKDTHTQFRHVYPSQSKSGDSCVSAFNHFLSHKDEVGAVYTDNSRELIATIAELGYRHQTSIEYVDRSNSFVEREIWHMLEGTRTNLVQSGLPVRMWPLAMQHFSLAVNASPQLNGDEGPMEAQIW